MSESLETALVRKVETTPAQRTVFDLLARQRGEVEKVLPTGVTFDRFERIVRTELRRTPKLLDCDPASLLGAVMLSAQLGLEPGPLGHAFLVPYKGKVEFIIGYRGMIDLAYRSGQVRSVTAGTVREGDAFDHRFGTRPFLDHSPVGPPAGREAVAWYAVGNLKTGGAPFVILYPEDVEKAKARSASGNHPASPWATDFDAMARKTAVRRLFPLLPSSPVAAIAVAKDETVGTMGDELPAFGDDEGGDDAA